MIHLKKIVCLTIKGFYDYSSATATKDLCILWDEVSEIVIKGIVNQSFVFAYLKNSEKVLANITGLQHKAIQANVKMRFWEINITSQNTKNCTNDKLVMKMNPLSLNYHANDFLQRVN